MEKAAALHLTGNSAQIIMSQAANMCPLPILCLKGSACTMYRSDRNTKSLETLCGARTTRSVQFKRCAVIKQVRRYRHHYYINTILKYYS